MNSVFTIQDFHFNYPLSDYKIGFTGQLEINSGDCILLQGASGSGKSTLLLALKGIIPHLINGDIHGKIKYLSQDITNLGEQDLLKIGYLQQNPDHQVIFQSVFEELAFGLENLGFSANEINEKIQQIASEFQIKHLLQQEIKSLSGGEKQKVNLIAILLMQPEVLLLDEPTAFLDPYSANEIANILIKYVKNKTVVIVEHNLQYLKNIVNRVVQINSNGEINEQQLASFNWQPSLPKATLTLQQNKEVVLKIENLHYKHKNCEDYLFENINLELKAGDVLAIHGKNGAGKSTLLKLIAKITPLKKSIYWQNNDIANLKDIAYWKDVHLLWQNPELHFIYNKVIEEVTTLEQLVTFGLEKQAQQSPFNLSEGQKRRLSLAIALAQDAKLLLLDEPSFGQDQENKKNLVKQINQLTQNGVAFIIVTHDEEFSNAIANRKLVLKDKALCE